MALGIVIGTASVTAAYVKHLVRTESKLTTIVIGLWLSIGQQHAFAGWVSNVWVIGRYQEL